MQYLKNSIYVLFLMTTASILTAQDRIIFKNGETIRGKTINTKIVKNIAEMASISLDGTKYKGKELRSYVKDDKYMVNIDNYYFLQAYTHGKINAIHVVENGGRLGVDKYYFLIQKGEDGKLESMTYKNLEAMISDNEAVMDKYRKMERKRQGSPYSTKEDEFLANINGIIEMYNRN